MKRLLFLAPSFRATHYPFERRFVLAVWDAARFMWCARSEIEYQADALPEAWAEVKLEAARV